MDTQLYAEVTQKKGKYTFLIQGFTGAYQITYADVLQPEQQRELCRGSNASITVPLPGTERVVFTITDASGQSCRCAARVLEDSELTNLRDIGGYRGQDGRRVKWGLLYRGCATGKLSEKQKQYVNALGLRTLFDLRSQSEVDKKADWVPPGCSYLHYPGIVGMDNDIAADFNPDGNLDMAAQLKKGLGDQDAVAVLKQYLQKAYASIVRQPEAFRQLLHTLLEKPGEAILFHCAAGKDRTGVAAAIILQLLGVADADIRADYMLTNACREKENQKILRWVGLISRNPEGKAIIADLMGVKLAYYETMQAGIAEHYGGFAQFVQEGLALTPGDVAQLQQLYLE